MFLIKKGRLIWIAFQACYAMYMITNLIEARMGKQILNDLIENNGLAFWNSYFFKLTLGSDCLKLCY